MQKFSIIIPCYNQAQFLEETLLSVFNQTYSNWECIIVNDGSLDNTEEIAKKWVGKDTRFVYLKKENGGLSSARNFGLKKASGDYIQFLDSDDLLDPKKIEFSLNSINQILPNQIIITNYKRLINKELIPPYYQIKPEYFNLDAILNKWDIEFAIPIHCAIFSKHFFSKISFNEQLKAKEDWVFWIDVFSFDINYTFIDESLAIYRFHQDSMTQSSNSLFEHTMAAIKLIKEKINPQDYQQFLLERIQFYYQRNNDLSLKYHQLKKSNSYAVGNKIRSILKKIGLINFSRFIINSIRK